MARIGNKRVDDVLDYERDIKGKRLIRLRAGVGAGKNYWARHLLEKHPNLQILIITSRRNTAEAEALHIGQDCKIHTSKLYTLDDRIWEDNTPGNLMICTNSYIEHFFKTFYQKDRPNTHLWNMFDLILVDEVHSLTSDASFADSPFAVECFISHTLRTNRKCDVVVMSGTPEPIEWLFSEAHWGEKYSTIDLYEQCIHLSPDKVYLFAKSIVAERIHYLWKQDKRVIYFVNSVDGMVRLINQLMQLGVPECDIGIAFSESDNADKLPQALISSKAKIRDHLISKKQLLPSVKIFISTSQNKEGISIEDDDIKYMFCESHNKDDLEQMAGRVRGNPETGTGLYALVVVYNADQHLNTFSYIEKEFDRALLNQVENIMEEHKHLVEKSGKKYDKKKQIAKIQKNHDFLRYDYINEVFKFYEGREQCSLLNKSNQAELQKLIELYDVHMYYETLSSGTILSVTGGYELKRKWFPYSDVSFSDMEGASSLSRATKELCTFLQRKGYINIEVNNQQQDEVMIEIHKLIEKYGKNELGFRNNCPKTLKPALKHFGLTIDESTNHHNSSKTIRFVSASKKEIAVL